MAMFKRGSKHDTRGDGYDGSTAQTATDTRRQPPPAATSDSGREREPAQAREPVHQHRSGDDVDAARRERFGGLNLGAAFFGWLVAVALTVLLAGLASAIAAAVGSSMSLSPSQAMQQAGAIGIATAIVLLVVLLVAYFVGGYVAGRMSRYSGGKQGLGVWLIGLVITIVLGIVGAVFGSQYNILAQANLPSMPMPTGAMTIGGLIALVVILLGTLLAAVLGGKTGRRYHRRVDRVT